MAKRGKDQEQRPQRASGRQRNRVVWVYPEGKVTEAEYLELLTEHGSRIDPARTIDLHIGTDKDRKPLTLVDAAAHKLRELERQAKRQKLHKLPKQQREWLWPQVWVLLHYQDYTSTFGGKCGSATDRLRDQPKFAQTYGQGVKKVSDDQVKHVTLGQIKGGFTRARGFAEKINAQHTGPDQNYWDPYTNVYDLISDGLGLRTY